MKLPAKQRLFVAEYLVDQNAAEAGRRCDISESTVTKYLADPEVKKEIDKGLRKLEAAAQIRAEAVGITKEKWLSEIAEIAFANMDDYATVGIGGVSLVMTDARPRARGRAIKKISESQSKTGYSQGIELHSKQAALELLGKHFGWVKEHVEHSGDGATPTVIILPSNGREAK